MDMNAETFAPGASPVPRLASAIPVHALSKCPPCYRPVPLVLALLGCDSEMAVRLLEPPARRAETSDDSTSSDDAYPITEAGQRAQSDAATNNDTNVDAEVNGLSSSALVHHYDFDGEGTVVADLVGDADGELQGGATLDGMGGVILDGVDDYVNLPNGIISALSSVTIVVWLEWYGGRCWQRVFDFGSSIQGEDTVASAETSLFLTPASCDGAHVGPVLEHVTSAMFHVRNTAYVAQQVDMPLPEDEPVFVALVVDPNRLTLTVNTILAAELMATLYVSELNDVNNWLGRSQWVQDPTFNGRFDDVRIYNRALTADELEHLFAETAVNR